MIIPLDAKIELADVARLFNVETSVKNVCLAEGINMWAKRKPIDASFDISRPSDWYKGRNDDFGISRTSYDTLDDVKASFETSDGSDGYTYYGRPTGSSFAPVSPYRLGDFRGYQHDAPPPVFGGFLPEVIYQSTNTYRYSMLINAGDDYTIGFTEFLQSFNVQTLYMRLHFDRQDTFLDSRNFDSLDIMSSAFIEVEIDTQQLVTGATYDVYPVLYDNYGRYYRLPSLGSQTVRIEASSIIVVVSGNRLGPDATTVTVKYRGQSNDPSITYYSFTNVFITLRFQENMNDFALPIQVGEQTKQVSNFTLSSGELTTTFNNLDLTKSYALQIVTNDGLHKAVGMILTNNPNPPGF